MLALGTGRLRDGPQISTADPANPSTRGSMLHLANIRLRQCISIFPERYILEIFCAFCVLNVYLVGNSFTCTVERRVMEFLSRSVRSLLEQ